MAEIVKILSKLACQKNAWEQITDFSRLWIEQTKKFSHTACTIIIKPPHYGDPCIVKGLDSPDFYELLCVYKS